MDLLRALLMRLVRENSVEELKGFGCEPQLGKEFLKELREISLCVLFGSVLVALSVCWCACI